MNEQEYIEKHKKFIDKISALADIYGFKKAEKDDDIDMWVKNIGQHGCNIIFFFRNTPWSKTIEINGYARGYQEYISTEGKHLISKHEEDIFVGKIENFDFKSFEEWMKIQNQVIARHDHYLKLKETKKNLKKMEHDFA